MFYGDRIRLRAIERTDLPTFATRTVLRFAFHELNLHRVELEVYDRNPRARRCSEKADFRHEGIRRQALFRDGSYHGTHRMAVLREEFECPQSTPGRQDTASPWYPAAARL
jgi:RimJ/RimL family protein N-acetyltransferase